MSIETLLTLGLTAAILSVAFVLRLVILGSLRLGLRLAGKDASWTRPQIVGSGSTARATADPSPDRRKRPLGTRRAGSGTRSASGAAGASLLAMAATAWSGITRGANSLERWADRTSESLQPAMRDITSAARRSTKDIGTYLVAGIATVQHVILLVAGWARELVTDAKRGGDSETRPTSGPGEVIDLDLDDDPLDSPETTRSRVSV